jgi:hypothetical protein
MWLEVPPACWQVTPPACSLCRPYFPTGSVGFPRGSMSFTYVGPGENAFLFVPNLIGYARVVLLVVACYYMLSDPLRCCVYYILSAFMDALDGAAPPLLQVYQNSEHQV